MLDMYLAPHVNTLYSQIRNRALVQVSSIYVYRAHLSVEKQLVLRLLRYVIGLKDSRHFSIQSDVKPKPIVTRSHAFSRALRQLHVITSNFDWFTVLSVFFVIG